MPVPELRLKDRTDLKLYMDQISRGAAAIKRAAHRFQLDETAHSQMHTLVLIVEKAATLMETLKTIEPDTSRQGVLIDLDSTELVPGKVIYTPNEPEAVEQEVSD